MRLMTPFARLGITPNMLTAISLLLSILAAAVITQGLLVIGGLLVLLAGSFDMFDGAMARVQNASTSFGAFFDSTLDRYSESIILLGLLVYALQRSPDFKEPLWPTSHEQTWMILFLYMAMVGSFLVSYTKARAEGLGVECHTGILARPERVVILALGLLSGTSIWMLALLAVFTNITAIERMIAVKNAMRVSSPIITPIPSRLSLSRESYSGETQKAQGESIARDAHYASSDTTGTTTCNEV